MARRYTYIYHYGLASHLQHNSNRPFYIRLIRSSRKGIEALFSISIVKYHEGIVNIPQLVSLVRYFSISLTKSGAWASKFLMMFTESTIDILVNRKLTDISPGSAVLLEINWMILVDFNANNGSEGNILVMKFWKTIQLGGSAPMWN